jgi:hypothetical protein
MIPAERLSSHDMARHPELAPMAVLASAIGALEAALWHEHPELDWEPNPPGGPHPPAQDCHIASSILLLTSELQAEIRRYWIAANGGQVTMPFTSALENGPVQDPDLQARLPF